MVINRDKTADANGFDEKLAWKTNRAKFFHSMGAGFIAASLRCSVGFCAGCHVRTCKNCAMSNLADQIESEAIKMGLDVNATIVQGKPIKKD